MMRKILLYSLFVLILLGLIAPSGIPARAQDGPEAEAAYNLNVRHGPGTTYAIITTLPYQTAVMMA